MKYKIIKQNGWYRIVRIKDGKVHSEYKKKEKAEAYLKILNID